MNDILLQWAMKRGEENWSDEIDDDPDQNDDSGLTLWIIDQPVLPLYRRWIALLKLKWDKRSSDTSY